MSSTLFHDQQEPLYLPISLDLLPLPKLLVLWSTQLLLLFHCLRLAPKILRQNLHFQVLQSLHLYQGLINNNFLT
ncbi:hypothetical protein AQUCO_00200468v1 [Aquilegia coerulea]|uniref:Uncharacterized protein n=1 Tax=Aquilegia coerulea TaxID=218851 RepID=A0A2G5F3D6_AQUCA|nr:hypothetical protein AQUCO_00200468v1 [Aquilegia coerulea]